MIPPAQRARNLWANLPIDWKPRDVINAITTALQDQSNEQLEERRAGGNTLEKERLLRADAQKALGKALEELAYQNRRASDNMATAKQYKVWLADAEKERDNALARCKDALRGDLTIIAQVAQIMGWTIGDSLVTQAQYTRNVYRETIDRCQLLNGIEARIEEILRVQVPEWRDSDASCLPATIADGVEAMVTKLRAELAAETARREMLEARCAEMAAALESIGELLKPHPYVSPDEDVTERPIICTLCGQTEDASTHASAHYPECPYPQIMDAIRAGKPIGSQAEITQVMQERDSYALALTRHCPICRGGGAVNIIGVDDEAQLEECPNCTPARKALAARDRELAARVFEEISGEAASQTIYEGQYLTSRNLLRIAAEYRSGARQIPGTAGSVEASNA